MDLGWLEKHNFLLKNSRKHHDIACSLSILRLLDLAPFPDWLSSSHGSVTVSKSYYL